MAKRPTALRIPKKATKAQRPKTRSRKCVYFFGSGKADGNYLVAVDTVDAGVGETVLIVSGSSARMASGMKDCPVDAAIVGIIDAIEVSD